jgi:hypothetical protein
VEVDGMLAVRHDLMLAGFSGGELHGIASTSLCLLLEMMASNSSCVLCYLSFAWSLMFVSYFSASYNSAVVALLI